MAARDSGELTFASPIVLTRRRLEVGASAADLDARARDFDRRHVIRLPGFFGADVLAAFAARLPAAEFTQRMDGAREIEHTLADRALLDLVAFTLNDPLLFALVERMTRCGPIGNFDGRVYRRIAAGDGAHYYPWHDDVIEERLVGLSVNLGETYDGGVLQIRERESQRIVSETANTGRGDAMLFRISPQLEHQVTPVTGSAARTTLAGWFRRAPRFWDGALDLSGGSGGSGRSDV